MSSSTAEIAGLSCDEVEALLPLVADEVLTAADEPDLFQHLAHCPDCQASLAAHDAVSLVLGGGAPVAQAQPAGNPVIHYHLSWPWAAAACALVAALAGVVVMASQSPGKAVSATAHTTVSEAEGLRILEVLPPGPGREQPVFVVRENGQIRIISSEQLDGGSHGARPPQAQAVTHGRFPVGEIRHLGPVD